MDYCPGGDLFFHMISRETFTEEEAKFYLSEILLAIEHLHEKNILYRDMKPENIMLGINCEHISVQD